MKHVKRVFIISIVLCVTFLLLNAGIIQPVQTISAIEAISNKSVDVQQVSESIYLVSVGNVFITVEFLENSHRLSTNLSNGETLTYEVITEERPLNNMSFGKTSNSESVEKNVLINGTKLDLPVTNPKSSPPHVEYPPEFIESRSGNITNYWWDDVLFEEDGLTITYPHPSRSNYSITSSYAWNMLGTELDHNQFSSVESSSFLIGGDVSSVLAGVAIGAMVGTYFDFFFEAFMGNLMAAVFSGLLVLSEQQIFLDELDCLWWWVNQDFINWLDNWAIYIMYLSCPEETVATEFEANGYLRVGDLTFAGYSVGIGVPIPPVPYYYISNVVQHPGYGSGYVSGWDNVRWSQPDGKLALIYGNSLGSGGQIVGRMSDVAHGEIWVYAGSVHGYNTHLYTYVSYNNNYDWVKTSDQTVYGGTGLGWIYCGSYSGNFRYLGIAAINDNGQPANIYIDATVVLPVTAATYGAGVFCPNNWQPAPLPYGANDTENEFDLSQRTCQVIYNYLNDRYDGTCYYRYGGIDPFQSPRVPAVSGVTYDSTLRALERNNDKVTVFSKGHCVPWGNGAHYRLMGTHDAQSITDNDIYYATGQSKTRFVFIWHCGTARSYPVAPPYYDGYGYIGLPFAFTHSPNLPVYGHSGSAVYLGWDYTSPQFETTIPENTAFNFADFAERIFWYMYINPNWDLEDALNCVSNQIYGTDFKFCPLYGELVVFGNMDMRLSY